MPLARIGSQILFFAHVPKTGGTSVEAYLQQKGPMALLSPLTFGWSASTPQHMPARVHRRFVPAPFCDNAFAVLRNPLPRMVSEYRWRVAREQVAERFEDWAPRMLAAVRADPNVFDNHLRPQCDFLRPRMALFRYERGLKAVYGWIDRVTGTPPADDSAWKVRSPRIEVEIPEALRAEILGFYARDRALIRAIGQRNGVRYNDALKARAFGDSARDDTGGDTRRRHWRRHWRRRGEGRRRAAAGRSGQARPRPLILHRAPAIAPQPSRPNHRAPTIAPQPSRPSRPPAGPRHQDFPTVCARPPRRSFSGFLSRGRRFRQSGACRRGSAAAGRCCRAADSIRSGWRRSTAPSASPPRPSRRRTTASISPVAWPSPAATPRTANMAPSRPRSTTRSMPNSTISTISSRSASSR